MFACYRRFMKLSCLVVSIAVTVAVTVASIASAGCGDAPPPHPIDGTLTVTSAAFEDGGAIPPEHGCDGAATSPPLAWSGAPDDTVELLLAVEHVNVPFKGRVIHWLVYGMPPTRTTLDEATPLGDEIEGGGLQGLNEQGGKGWIPPCPPLGEGRYAFFLYALDEQTGLEAGATRDAVALALEGRVLASGELLGTFAR